MRLLVNQTTVGQSLTRYQSMAHSEELLVHAEGALSTEESETGLAFTVIAMSQSTAGALFMGRQSGDSQSEHTHNATAKKKSAVTMRKVIA